LAQAEHRIGGLVLLGSIAKKRSNMPCNKNTSTTGVGGTRKRGTSLLGPPMEGVTGTGLGTGGGGKTFRVSRGGGGGGECRKKSRCSGGETLYTPGQREGVYLKISSEPEGGGRSTTTTTSFLKHRDTNKPKKLQCLAGKKSVLTQTGRRAAKNLRMQTTHEQKSA